MIEFDVIEIQDEYYVGHILTILYRIVLIKTS